MYTQQYTVEKEYIVPKDKFTEYLVLSLSIFLFIIAWIIILYFASIARKKLKTWEILLTLVHKTQ
jgi:hypothetical protein